VIFLWDLLSGPVQATPAPQSLAAQSIVDSLGQQDAALMNGNPDVVNSSTTGLQGTEVQTLKRLLREVFADLVSIKQQLQDLTMK